MEKGVSNQGVSNQMIMALAIVLVLLIVGGTYLVLQEVKSIHQELANKEAVVTVPPPIGARGGVGEVTIYVIAPEQPAK